jgi:hypothetical protein
MEGERSRCNRCGSRKLTPVSVADGQAATKSWAARQRQRMLRHRTAEAEFPTIGMGEVLSFAGIATLKMLIEIPLGVSLLLSAAGPGGVTATTFAWRYPLGLALIVSAASGLLGAYGLFYLERFGPILLSISFCLDALLLSWLVVHLTIGQVYVWPGEGPYFFLLVVSAVLSAASGRLATGNHLGSA